MRDVRPGKPEQMTDLNPIFNWRRMSELITLSGQPTEEQLAELKAEGVTHVINLGIHESEDALPDEAGSVAALGMQYIHIPVDFENPTDQDFNTFCEALLNLPDQRIHVHCIYNARVSAFVYRYARTGRGMAEADALALMDSIWRPGGHWAEFIGNKAAKDLPNRYAGKDY
jgi:protein tyrosine phosphatase (PTP) superfamily phosphohydrolase (DUF442 family)